MTFAQYAAQLGVLLLQWLPICGLMYLAVRLGVTHGLNAVIQATAQRESILAQLTPEQRKSIGVS